MTTFLQKTFLLGAVVASAVSASDCSNMGGFRVGIGLGVANGVSTQKVSTVGVTQSNGNIIPQIVDTGAVNTSGAPEVVPVAGTSTGGWSVFAGQNIDSGFTPMPFLSGVSGSNTLYSVFVVDTPSVSPGTMSRKANLGKVGLAGALNLEYWMYVGGSALVGFGVDVHNGTGYMNGSKDAGSTSSTLPISTKVKTVWGVTPKLMFGWQLAPRTMLTFSVGASIDKYKAQSIGNKIDVFTNSATYNSNPVEAGSNMFAADGMNAMQQSLDFSTPGYVSTQKFNKTKVGIQLGLGMRTIVAPNVELMIEGKATFGKAIKLNDKINWTNIPSAIAMAPLTETVNGTTTTVNSSLPISSQTQKFTVQKYELLVGVAYKFGGSDKASAAA